MSPPFPVKPVPTQGYFPSANLSYNTSTSSVHYSDMRPYMDPRTLMESNIDPRAGVSMGGNYGIPMGLVQDPNISGISHNTSYSTIPHRDPSMAAPAALNSSTHNMSVIPSQDPCMNQSINPFIYPSSPSLYMNPRDRDNASDVSGFAKATPMQLVFSNQSTPVRAAPQKVFKPIQHSPMKQVSNRGKHANRFNIPEKVINA